jgi:hypothetical protein
MARTKTEDEANLILSLLDALSHVAVGWHDRIPYRLQYAMAPYGYRKVCPVTAGGSSNRPLRCLSLLR